MTLIRKSMRLPYAATDMFALICDVRSYPSFVRWITALRVERELLLPGRWEAIASADVLYSGTNNSFTTSIRADRLALDVEVELLHGPLRYLQNRWKITAINNACLVDFMIDFEFSHPLLRLLSTVGTPVAAEKLVKLFVREAKSRFGALQEKPLITAS